MFSKKEELKKLINEKQEKLKAQIKLEEQKLDDDRILYEELKENVEKITNITEKDLFYYINQFEVEEKDTLYNELLKIQKILITNQQYSSTLRLFEKDKAFYDMFLKAFSNYLEKKKNNNPVKKDIEHKIEEYDSLKKIIEIPNFQINSHTLELITELFKDTEDASSEKVLIELMKYEKDTYQEKLSNSIKKDEILLSIQELEKIFNLYHYDFHNLYDTYKEYLMHYGNIDKIKQILEALERNQYPIIQDGYVLTSILLGSSRVTIDAVTSFSRENNLIPESLLDISGALLEQKDFSDKDDDYSYMMVGSSLDFMRNVVTLKNAGISINYIFQECKSILTMPNKLLVTNLDLFYKYGFSFDYKRRGIIDPSPAALLSTNFASICDAFIEIHPLGLKYLIDNLSNLRTVSNPKALMFYNIYASNMTTLDLDDNDPRKGPFRKVLEEDNENYQLKAIITRNRPDYRDSYYLNIQEENKLEITNTIEVHTTSTKKYDRIIDANPNYPISDSIFSNSYIESIDKYIDRKSALIYNFYGTRISRLKVLRIYNTLLKNGVMGSLESFMYALTYNSILSQEDYDKILNCIRKEVEVG